jgi:predicted Rossmann-fold nucleotide-binding protein
MSPDLPHNISLEPNKTYQTVDALITPTGRLNSLSKIEVARLLDASQTGLYKLFRNCSLAVLNTGNDLDDGKKLLERYHNFDIKIVQQERGIKLALKNAPAESFVEGKIIKGIGEHLFTVLRDVIYAHDQLAGNTNICLTSSEGLTDAVFHMMRNAALLQPELDPNLVVCWGGHSIGRVEYDYSKEVGYQLGLRNMDICTGCGPGAMKGPMKGATIGHAKQRIYHGRYIGITEPGIIAAEAPNPIVNQLSIMPDIEKRLEAFVRIGHGIIVFPGGAGTAEEILYILGILLHPDNKDIPFPLIFTGPRESADYFKHIDTFIGQTLGKEAQKRYKIIVDNPTMVANEMKRGIQTVREFRKRTDDAYYFNWHLKIAHELQIPFIPSHENMSSLALHKKQPTHELAANLRRVFSGIVAGNVKEDGIRAIEEHGIFHIHGDSEVMTPVDELLSSFVAQNRMKLPGTTYTPCYKIVT